MPTTSYFHLPIDFSFIMGATWVTLFTMAVITLVGLWIARRIKARDEARRHRNYINRLEEAARSHTFPCVICGALAHSASHCRQHIKESRHFHVPYAHEEKDQRERDYGRL